MSRLSLTEKEHWKSRIENRINRAIELVQAKDIQLMPRIREQAELKAHKLLGTDKIHAKIQAIKKQCKELTSEGETLEKEMYQLAFGKPSTPNPASYQMQCEFWALHKKSQARIEDELLKESKVGKEILNLQSEKDALLDTVWLATSNAQIRELWGRVSEVLGDPATPLQQKILADGSASTSTE